MPGIPSKNRQAFLSAIVAGRVSRAQFRSRIGDCLSQTVSPVEKIAKTSQPPRNPRRSRNPPGKTPQPLSLRKPHADKSQTLRIPQSFELHVVWSPSVSQTTNIPNPSLPSQKGAALERSPSLKHTTSGSDTRDGCKSRLFAIQRRRIRPPAARRDGGRSQDPHGRREAVDALMQRQRSPKRSSAKSSGC